MSSNETNVNSVRETTISENREEKQMLLDKLLGSKTVVLAKNLEFDFDEQTKSTQLALLSYLFNLIIQTNGVLRQIDANVASILRSEQGELVESNGVQVRQHVRHCLTRNKQIYQMAKKRLGIILDKSTPSDEALEKLDLNAIKIEIVLNIKELREKMSNLNRHIHSD